MNGPRTALPNLNEIRRENEIGTSPDTEFDAPTTPPPQPPPPPPSSETAIFRPNDFGTTRASRPMFPNLPTSVSTSRLPSVIRLGSSSDVTNEARQYGLLNTDSEDEVASTTDQEANEVSGEEVLDQRLFEPDERYHHLRQPGDESEGTEGGAETVQGAAVAFGIDGYATSRRENDSLQPVGGSRGEIGAADDAILASPETGSLLAGLSLNGMTGTVGSGAALSSDLSTVGRPLHRMFPANRLEVGEEATRLRANRSSYPPQLPDHRGRATAIHLGRRHPPPTSHWNRSSRLAQLTAAAATATPTSRSSVSSAATTPRDDHFGHYLHSHQQHQRSVSGNLATTVSASTLAVESLPFSTASPEGWVIAPRSNVAMNGDHVNRFDDSPRAPTLPVFPHSSSTSSEAEDDIGDGCSPDPHGWRASCKDSRARFKYVLESELFADVCFLVGAAPRSANTVSNRPSRVPTLSRQPTFSNETEDRKQRMISSMIAQVSGSVSRGQASPPNGAVEAPVDEPTAAEKAKRLTELLLAMNMEQSTASEGMLRPSEVSLDPSPSSTASSSSAPTSSSLTENEDQPSVAVMCDMTDTSDIDSDERPVDTVSTCTQTRSGALIYRQIPKTQASGPVECSEATAAAAAVATVETAAVGSTLSSSTVVRADEAMDGLTKKSAVRPESPDSTSRMDFREGDQLQLQQQQQPTRFSAHRLILALASPVFEAMFFGLFTENMACNRRSAAADGGNTTSNGFGGSLPNKSNMLELCISDVTPKAFQQCLRFIYHDDLQLPDDIDELYDILYAAKKYLLPQLASASASQLINHMTPQNVLFQLNKSSAIDEEELTRICWRTIDLMTSEVLASEPFVDLSKETVLELISRDTLCCEEWEIFEAVHRWASAECDRRGLRPTSAIVTDLMADFLPFIRFTTMSLGDFVLHVAKSGVLSLELQRDISVFIATKMFSQEELSRKDSDSYGNPPTVSVGDGDADKPVSSTNHLPTNLAISAAPRSGPPLVRCLRSSHAMVPMSKEGYWQEPEAVAFEVSSTVFLAGIGVSEPVGRGSSLKLKIEVRRCSIRQTVHVDTGARFHTVGVSTSIHRHTHQLHSVSTQSAYLPRPGDDTRRRILRSGGGGGGSNNYRPALPSSLDQPNSRGSGGRSGLKLLVNRTHVLGSTETVIRGSGSRPVAQIRFPKPIMLKGGKTYVVIVRPEEGRHTRCYVHMNVARTEVRVKTRRSKQGEKPPAASWFPLAVPKHVVFHFYYCDKSQTNCSTEGNHIPELLFCPPT